MWTYVVGEKPQARSNSQNGTTRFRVFGQHDDYTKMNKWPLKKDHPKRKWIMVQPSIFRGHVRFQGSMMDVCNLIKSCLFHDCFMHLDLYIYIFACVHLKRKRNYKTYICTYLLYIYIHIFMRVLDVVYFIHGHFKKHARKKEVIPVQPH